MPGNTQALIGAGVVVVVVAGVMAWQQWRPDLTSHRWRALTWLLIALWALVLIESKTTGWTAGTTVAVLVAIGVAATIMVPPLLHLGLPPQPFLGYLGLALSVPVAGTLPGVLPGLRELVLSPIPGPSGGWNYAPGPSVMIAAIWLSIMLSLTGLTQIAVATQAVGPTRFGVVFHGLMLVILSTTATLISIFETTRPWLEWTLVITVVVRLATDLGPGSATWDRPLQPGVSDVLDHVSDALAVVSLDGSLIDTNRSGHEVLTIADHSGGWFGVPHKALDPLLLPASLRDGEMTVTTSAGVVLRVKTSTVLEGNSPVARILTARDITEMERIRAELLDLANRDALTGLLNRRDLGTRITNHIKEVHLGAGPLCVAIVDLDNLKTINDQFGHAVGDSALVCVAKILADDASGRNTAVRVGGDEFMVVLTGTSVAAALTQAKQWQREAGEIVLGADANRVTLSIGVAAHQEDMDAESLITAADAALYAAKAAGRDRVRATPAQERVP